jgi:hypothetical protein
VFPSPHVEQYQFVPKVVLSMFYVFSFWFICLWTRPYAPCSTVSTYAEYSQRSQKSHLCPSPCLKAINKNCYTMTFRGDHSGISFFPSFVALVHKNPSYVECTRYIYNTLLVYVKYNRWPQTQFNHGIRCFTRHHYLQDEQIFCLYGSCVFPPCMCTGWLLETTPSNHY